MHESQLEFFLLRFYIKPEQKHLCEISYKVQCCYKSLGTKRKNIQDTWAML